MSVPSIRTSLITDQLASSSRKTISLVTSSRNRAIRDNEAQRIFFNSSERKIWYQKADEKDEDARKDIASRHSITLPVDIRIEEIKQANGGSDNDPTKDGIWVSKQGYMDKTIIRLSNKSNESISLIISPFLFNIQISDGPVTFD